jgi:HEAT repeat protein
MESQRAEDKLFEVARRADNTDLRRQAIHWIGEKASKRSLDFLKDTVNASDADTEVQKQAVHAISEKPAEQSVPLLIQIAKTHPNAEVRKAAIRWLGESGDPRALEYFREVLSK